MELYKYWPVPSDRMGLLWTLLNIKDGVVLEYGPTGTTHYSMNLFMNLGIECRGRLFATGMSEKNVVMGDTKILEEAIKEIDFIYKPHTIFVVASTIAAVTGVDIAGICQELATKVNANLVGFPLTGRTKDYTFGIEAGLSGLVQNLCQDCQQEEKLFNIIGASAYSYRIKADVREVARMMKAFFDYDVYCTLAVDTDIETIKTAAKAKVNIVLGQEGIKAADYLKRRFNIPYVFLRPYGYNACVEAVKAIGIVCKLEPNARAMDRLLKKSHYVKQLKTLIANKQIKGKALVKGDYDLVQGIHSMLNTYGFSNIACISNTKINDSSINPDISFYNAEQWVDLCQNIEDTMILGDDALLKITKANNYKVLISEPSGGIKAIAEHMPLMGERGADYWHELIASYMGGYGRG